VKAFIAALIIGILILLQPGQSPVLYVAPYGTAIAAGDSDSPRTLASVLCTGCVPAGSTVFLLPGRYVGPFVSNVSGSATSPITIRSVPGTRARLAAVGFDSWKAIAAASDDDLLAVEGIGPATLKKIRAGA
jgi:hypothetical protein